MADPTPDPMGRAAVNARFITGPAVPLDDAKRIRDEAVAGYDELAEALAALQTSGGTEEDRHGSDAGTGVAPPATAAPVPSCPICDTDDGGVVPHHDCPDNDTTAARVAFDQLIDDALDTAARNQTGLTDPEAVRDAIGDPDDRDVVAAWLVDVGFLQHAGVWERPEVDLDAMEQAKARYYRENQQQLDDEADGRPWTQEMVDAMLAHARGWHDRRRIVDGPRFYYEGEDRPPGAIPLYQIAGGS